MEISNEIIEILNFLCEKIGFTIDWTTDNIIPYIQMLCEKFIKWQIGTSITWIVIAIVAAIVAFIFSEIECESGIFWITLAVALIVIGIQTFDIVECVVFPEKAIYDYIEYNYIK